MNSSNGRVPSRGPRTRGGGGRSRNGNGSRGGCAVVILATLFLGTVTLALTSALVLFT